MLGRFESSWLVECSFALFLPVFGEEMAFVICESPDSGSEEKNARRLFLEAASVRSGGVSGVSSGAAAEAGSSLSSFGVSCG